MEEELQGFPPSFYEAVKIFKNYSKTFKSLNTMLYFTIQRIIPQTH